MLLNRKFHHRVNNSLTLVPILSRVNSVHVIPSCFFEIHFIIILPSTLRSSKCPFSLGFDEKILCACLISSMRATCPAHLILINSIIYSNIWWTLRIIKLLITQFSPVCSYFLPLRPRSLSQHPIFEHPQPMLFPESEDQVSHPHKTTGNIISDITVYYSPTDAQVVFL